MALTEHQQEQRVKIVARVNRLKDDLDEAKLARRNLRADWPHGATALSRAIDREVDRIAALVAQAQRNLDGFDKAKGTFELGYRAEPPKDDSLNEARDAMTKVVNELGAAVDRHRRIAREAIRPSNEAGTHALLANGLATERQTMVLIDIANSLKVLAEKV